MFSGWRTFSFRRRRRHYHHCWSSFPHHHLHLRRRWSCWAGVPSAIASAAPRTSAARCTTARCRGAAWAWPRAEPRCSAARVAARPPRRWCRGPLPSTRWRSCCGPGNEHGGCTTGSCSARSMSDLQTRQLLISEKTKIKFTINHELQGKKV